jgi:hypothetical protein
MVALTPGSGALPKIKCGAGGRYTALPRALYCVSAFNQSELLLADVNLLETCWSKRGEQVNAQR